MPAVTTFWQAPINVLPEPAAIDFMWLVWFSYNTPMPDVSSSQPAQRGSSVHLARSSQSWTDADSAAGFVLRYLTPMRRQLIEVMGSPAEADECLKLLLAHLISAGFGEHKRGRLRDFLVRGVRSCAKARLAELPSNEQLQREIDQIQLDSKFWLRVWRDCLLDRAWRALERHQHGDPGSLAYVLLTTSVDHPQASPDELLSLVQASLSDDSGEQWPVEVTTSLDTSTMVEKLNRARALYAQLIADEVVETLETPDPIAVKKEIQRLGLGRAFEGLGV